MAADGRRNRNGNCEKRWTRMPRILNGETAGYGNGNCKGFWNGSW